MKELRHAVVVVHGIGEQVPLETIRSFVGTVGPPAPDAATTEPDSGVAADRARVFSEPSPAALRSNDRIYVARWIHDRLKLNDTSMTGMDERERIPGKYIVDGASFTDFYEYYWAPRYRLTTLGQVVSWMVELIKRPRRTYSTVRILGPPQVWKRAVPCVIVAIALATSAWMPLWPSVTILGWAVPLLLIAALAATYTGLLAMFRNLVVIAVAAFVVPFVVLGVDWSTAAISVVSGSAVSVPLGWIGRGVALTIGDAANYLSNRPHTIEENDLVQASLIRLLEQLHDMDNEDGSPRYERIVVVGHSLGSVIAYDAVTLLWARRNRLLPLPAPTHPSTVSLALKEVEQAGTDLQALWDRAVREVEQAGTGWQDLWAGSNNELDRARRGFHERQRALFCALQVRSNRLDRTAGAVVPSEKLEDRIRRARWIISDLVTLGSPLTYADAFLAFDEHRLQERFRDRSLSRCPPARQQTAGTENFPYRITDSFSNPTRSWLHQASAFAATVWTNHYFAHDLVGGPVAPHFGPGIDDKRLPGGADWVGWMLFSYPHSSYWTVSKRPLNQLGSTESLELLRRLVRRHPTYLLRLGSPETSSILSELTQLLGPAGRSATSKIELEVRLQALDSSSAAEYLPAYLPVSKGFLVWGRTDHAIEKLLRWNTTRWNTTQLLYGFDPFVGPVDHDKAYDVARQPAEAEPGAPSQAPGG